MFLLGILCLLSALTAPCHSLNCIECMSTNSTSCTGFAVSCPNGYACATSSTESTAGGSNSTRYIRSCAPSSVCDKVGSISSPYGNVKTSTSCCHTDNCTASILAVPSVSSEPNGVTCPTCQSSSSSWCYEEKTVDCTGEEKVCALYSTDIDGSRSSIRGCANQNICSTQKYSVNGTNISYQSTCYCGGNSSNTYCPDTNVTCPTGTICARVQTQRNVSSASSEINRTACLPIYQCGISSSATFPGGTLRMMTICSTNNCSLNNPTWSSLNSTANGVTCPACMSSNSEWCTGATMQCTGSETVCMIHTEKLLGTPSVMRGCTTRSNCYLGQLSHSAKGSEFDFKFICPTGGYNISCLECMDSTNCPGNSVTCPTGSVCATSYTESTVGGSVSNKTFIRSCAPSNQCDRTGSVSSPYGNITMSSSCCAFDNCSSSPPPVPSVSPQPNGVTCPTCQSTSSGWCYDEQTVECTGAENVCVLYSTNINGSLSSVRGCARRTCGSERYRVNGTGITYTSNCYCGGNASNTYCPDTNVICPRGTICARVYAVTTMDNTSVEVNNSACLPIYQCGVSGSSTFLNGTQRLVTICSTNSCTLPDPVLTGPATNSSYNGVTCPTCMSKNLKWCTAVDTMQCIGSESICSVHSVKMTGAPAVIRGCATKSFCSLGHLSHSAGSIFDFKFICPNGGYNLSCSECTDSTTCTGTNVTCPSGSICATSYTESTMGGSKSTRYIQSCAPASQCDKTGSISTVNGNTKMSTSCCAFDNCSSSILPVPSVSSQPNGVTCPACQSSSSGWCYMEQTVQCTGNETVCVLYTTNINGSLSSIRGCTQQGTCGSQKYSVNGTAITYQPTCYCGGDSGNTFCPDTNVTCPSGTICARVHALSTVGNTSVEINNSTCLPIYQCGISGSASSLNGTLRLMTICSTNTCNLPEPALTGPSSSSGYNGVTCPTCTSENSEWCTAKDTMQCIGSENVCLIYSSKLSGTPSVVRGCATRSNCYLSHLPHSMTGSGSNFDFKFICSSRGYSLSCTECTDTTNCSGNNVTCPSGYVCATSYTESTVGGSKSTRYIRSCSPSSQCDRTGSISIIDGNTKMSSSCCAFDNCSPSILPVPSTSSQFNGVTCSACQSSSSIWCYNNQTLQCTGEEDVCVLYSTNITGSVSSIRGCTQQSACSSQKYSVKGTSIAYQPNCYCGGNSSNTYCLDTNTTCPKGTVCGRVHSLTTLGNTSFETYNSTCLPLDQCGISGSLSVLNGTVKLVTVCSTSGCNLPEPLLTGPISSYNGVTCPTCVAENSDWCDSKDTMQCSGNETACLTYNAKVSGTPMVFRGCATKTNCVFSNLTHSANGSQFDFKFDCSTKGHSLTCIECMSTNSTSCTGDAVTCLEGYFCATSYTESTVGGQNSTRYVRSCAPQNQCNKAGRISTLDGTMKWSTSCCSLDNCTEPILPVPPVGLQPNGVTCPTCQSSSSSWCYNTQTVDCSGDETVCALYSTTIGGSLSSIRGCTQQGTCGSQKYSVNGTAITYQSTCYCGGNSSNTYCPDTNVTCPTGTICARVQTLSTVASASSEINKTACLPIYQCGISSSATFPGGTLRMMTICSTNNCNLNNPTWSSPNLTANGVTCPACMSSNSEWCTAKTTMQCTGSETVCMVHTEKLLGTPSVMLGCTTRSNCYLGQLSHSAKGSEFDFKFICPTGGYSISCLECMDSANCTGNSVTCPSGSVCATSYTKSTVGGPISRFIRSCAPSNQCDRIGSVSSPNGNIAMSSSCCAFDNCSSSPPPVSPVSPELNGVTCPTCQSSSSGWCYDEQTVNCTGEETVCVLYSTNINGGLSSVRGCARCTRGTERYRANGTGITYTSNCYCGGNASTTYCPDTNVSCPRGTICARVYAVTTMDNTSVEVNNSACLPIYQCGISGSSTFLNGTQRLVTICSTDGCTLPNPALTGPAPNSSNNGVTCPTCMAENLEWCTAEDTMQCVGSESICSVHSVKMTGAPAVIRGCATRSFCSLGHLSHSAGSIFDFKFICPNGGYSLSCSECTDLTNCSGPNVTCPSGSVCATSYTESTVGGSKSTRYIRSCTPPSQCDQTGSISTLYGNTKMSTSCCAFDNCSSSILPVPSVSSQPNGVTCPTCQSSSFGWCYKEQAVQCTGNETVCVLYSTNINGQSSAIRGCAQPSVCNNQTYTIGGQSIVYQSICYCGGNASNTYCPETNVTCPSGTVCSTVHALTTMGDASFKRDTNTCSPIYQCGVAGSATFLKGTMKLVTQCFTNNCNLPTAEFSADSSGNNGMQCQNCMAQDTDCLTSERLQCTGNEDSCFFQASDLTGATSAKTAIRGCSTRNICELGTQTYNALGITSNVKYVCSSGSKHFLTSFFNVFVLCALTLQYLF